MSNDEDDEQKNDLDQVSRAIAILSKRFDAVQVFCSRHPGDERGTRSVRKGSGNWFARYGLVREWLVQEEHGMRSQVDP